MESPDCADGIPAGTIANLRWIREGDGPAASRCQRAGAARGEPVLRVSFPSPSPVMKRANETPAYRENPFAFTEAEPGPPGRRPPPASTAPNGTVAPLQPGVTSVANRTGAAILPPAFQQF